MRWMTSHAYEGQSVRGRGQRSTSKPYRADFIRSWFQHSCGRSRAHRHSCSLSPTLKSITKTQRTRSTTEGIRRGATRIALGFRRLTLRLAARRAAAALADCYLRRDMD